MQIQEQKILHSLLLTAKVVWIRSQKPPESLTSHPLDLLSGTHFICVPDALQLQASGTGTFSWTPPLNIVNSNTATPTVNPSTTTYYHVQLDQFGCINNDSVRVRVVSLVTLSTRPDTTICLTDSVQLNIVSDGLRYLWDPSATLNDPTHKESNCQACCAINPLSCCCEDR